MTFPGLETDRLSIHPLAAPDGEAASRPEPTTSGIEVRLALRLRETGQTIGNIGLQPTTGDGKEVEVEITLAPDYQGNGLAREALHPVLSYLFNGLGIATVRGRADSRSQASVRLMQSMGMKRETLVLRSALVRGEWIDHVYHTISRDQWRAPGTPLKGGGERAPDGGGEMAPDGGGEMAPDSGSDFWVVTSFFNPAGYRSHLPKFRAFRERIGAPLFAVELAYGTDFELGPGDADCLLRLRSDQVLWQKERILNLAIEALPEPCRFVAWVDADVVFEHPDWAERAREALETHALVQPYGRVYDLPGGADPGPSSVGRALLTRPSLAWVSEAEDFDPTATSADMTSVGSPGHAWAMRRDSLEEVGLYDAMVVGSGDNAIALASLGHSESIVAAYGMNDLQANHYRRWAARFQAVPGVGVGVGHVSGDLYHLWHGDFSDRGYAARYPGLAPFRFDPELDLALDENGAWRWASDKPELHAYVASYFRSRKEDG